MQTLPSFMMRGLGCLFTSLKVVHIYDMCHLPAELINQPE